MPRPTAAQIKTAVILILLAGGVVFQAITLAKPTASDLLSVYKVVGQPSLWRGANFAGGANFANYVSFLIENIPEDARVALPPDGVGPWALSRTPYMQFYLAPREVINCTSSDAGCAADLAASGAYLVVVGEDGFPGKGVTTHPERLRMFNDSWGVYPPEKAGAGQPLRPYSSLLEILQQAVWPVLWLAVISLAGLGILHSLLPELRLSSKLVLGYGLSVGGVSLLASLAGLLGVSLSRSVFLAITLVWSLLGGAAYFLGRRRVSPASGDTRRVQRPFDLWHALLAAVSGVAALLAVGKAYAVSDEVILWGVKGYGIAARGLAEGASQWGTRTVSYPLNIPLAIAAFKSLFDETLPASKLIFPLFFLATLVLLYDTLCERTTRVTAGLAALLLATAPIIFQHAAIGYANLPLAYYLFAGVILLQGALQARQPSEQRRFCLAAGCALALAAWTRTEGLQTAWAFAILAGAWIWWKGGQEKPWPAVLSLFAPLALYTVFWLAAGKLIYPPTGRNDELVSTAIQQLSRGNFHPNELAYTLRYFVSQLFTPSMWGAVGVCLLLLPWLGTRPAQPERGANHYAFFAALLALLLILGIYLLASYGPGPDISVWVKPGLNRMIFPGMVILWLVIASRLVPRGAAAPPQNPDSMVSHDS